MYLLFRPKSRRLSQERAFALLSRKSVYTFFCLKMCALTKKKPKNWGTWLKQINIALVHFTLGLQNIINLLRKRFLIMMQSILFTEKAGYLIKGTALIYSIHLFYRQNRSTHKVKRGHTIFSNSKILTTPCDIESPLLSFMIRTVENSMRI